MDLTLTEEQRMLAASVRAFVTRECPTSLVRELEKQERGYSPEHWARLATLGVPGLCIAEGHGGVGRGLVDMAVVCLELGRGPVPTPLIASSVLSAHLVASAGSEPQRSGWLRDLAEGRRVATLSVLEPGSRDEWEPARLTVRRDGTHVVCTGAKMLVPFASSADLLLVVGRSVHGPTVVAVDPNAPGVSVRRQHDAGGEPVYEVRLDGVLVPETDVVGGFGGAMATLSAALDRATVAAIAYAVGGARRALEMTVEHAKTREQFGRPIGSFQAVAHRCVDMLADIDACELLCLQAAWCIDHRQSAEFEVAAAKAYATDGIRRIYANAHQVHGAIGLSMEHDLQLYSRRGKVFELTYGGASLHRERVARALGLDAG